MQAAITKDSPFGRYLAELEGHADAEADDGASSSLAHALRLPCEEPRRRPRSPTASASPTQRWDASDMVRWPCDGITSAWRRLRGNAEMFAVDRLVDQLGVVMNELRVELLEAAPRCDISVATRWWLPSQLWRLQSAPVGPFVLSGGCCALAIGAMGVGRTELIGSGLLGLCLLALSVESIHQAWLAWHYVTALRLVKALRFFVLTRERFESAFQESLGAIKRTELATRGYRLGRLLPPIGRVEESDNHAHAQNRARGAGHTMHLRRLRVRLRVLNDRLHAVAGAIQCRSLENVNEYLTADPDQDKESATNTSAPSLLITALEKRHELAMLTFERVMRQALIEDLAHGLTDGHALNSIATFGVYQALSSQTWTHQQLSQILGLWTRDLERSHARILRRTTSTSSQPLNKSNELQGDEDRTPLTKSSEDNDDPARRAVRQSLEELLCSCDTLRTAILATVETFEAEDGDHTKDGLGASNACIELLRDAQAQFTNLATRLQADLAEVDAAIARMRRSGAQAIEIQQASDTTATDACDTVDVQTPRPNHRGVEDPERDCLLVFTGTSTGERDFDLQALIKQRQLDEDSSNISQRRTFVDELQNVLDKRQVTHTAPTVIRSLDEDGKRSRSTLQDKLPTTAVVQALQLGSLQDELAVRFGGPNDAAEEAFGDSDTSDDDTA